MGLKECKQVCNKQNGCNSFALCEIDGEDTCYFKYKALNGSEPSKFKTDPHCTTHFRTCGKQFERSYFMFLGYYDNMPSRI